mmetsp:Transcript_57781/g.125440  ORF Transcript_57781/g.125440 Transcript_57781/m.125440 type:complete len:506 (+) Transcript_57781:473-1990(+)
MSRAPWRAKRPSRKCRANRSITRDGAKGDGSKCRYYGLVAAVKTLECSVANAPEQRRLLFRVQGQFRRPPESTVAARLAPSPHFLPTSCAQLLDARRRGRCAEMGGRISLIGGEHLEGSGAHAHEHVGELRLREVPVEPVLLRRDQIGHEQRAAEEVGVAALAPRLEQHRLKLRQQRGRDGGADGGESVCGHGVFLGVGPGGARGVVDDAARGVVVDAAEGVGVDAEQCVGVGVGRGLTVGVNVRVRGIQLRWSGDGAHYVLGHLQRPLQQQIYFPCVVLEPLLPLDEPRALTVLAERCGRESAVARQRPLRAVLLPLPKLIGRPNELGPEEELIHQRLESGRLDAEATFLLGQDEQVEGGGEREARRRGEAAAHVGLAHQQRRRLEQLVVKVDPRLNQLAIGRQHLLHGFHFEGERVVAHVERHKRLQRQHEVVLLLLRVVAHAREAEGHAVALGARLVQAPLANVARRRRLEQHRHAVSQLFEDDEDALLHWARRRSPAHRRQ